MDGVVGRVRGVATHRRFLPLGLGRGLLENLIFFSFISDNSFGSVDDFLISVRCYVMILLLGIFYISPLPFSRFNLKQCLILLVVQTGITVEMLFHFSLSIFQLYI